MSSGGFDVVAVVRRVVSIDGPSASLDEIDWGISAIDRMRCWFDARRAALLHERTLPRPLPTPVPDPESFGAAGDGDGEGPDDAEHKPPAEPLPDLGATPPPSRREQALLDRRAAVLALAALFLAALEAGRITTDHVDVLAGVLHDLRPAIRDRVLADEEGLLDKARSNTPESFGRLLRREVDRATQAEGDDLAARQRAKCRLRRWDGNDGMRHIHLTLDSELANRFDADLNAETEAMYRAGDAKDLDYEQVSALAMLNLMRSGRGAPRRSNPDKVQFMVLADFDTIFGGLHDRSVLETASGRSMHLETARRLWCDAEITWAITVNGKVVKLVCEDELANRKQRRALRVMYRTCVHPECDVPFDRCHIHHVTYRHRGGKTVLENLAPLCYRHHTMVHEGGWRLTMDADRTLHWQRPDGTVYADCPFVPLADIDRVRTAGGAAATDASTRPPNGQSPARGAPPGGAPPGGAPPGVAPPGAAPPGGVPPGGVPPGSAPTSDADHDGELRLFPDTSAAAA